MLSEAEIRDQLATRLTILEPGLVLLAKEHPLPNAFGSKGFIDILAKDCLGNRVIIEVKRSNATARQALHEILKYAALFVANEGLSLSKIRCFGATIHNMRGLLTPVCSSAQSLLNKVVDGRVDAADLKKHLKRIVDATGDLSRLLEEVRRYSQQVSRERTRERLQSLVAESLENAKACFSQTGHDVELISLRIEVPAEITVEVSKVHLVVALTNLLQNSFEAFKPVMDQVGPFWIAVSAHADDAGDVTVTIEDNGIGFGEDDLRQIRQFIPGQTTLKHDGTGFGLPTAKRYIEGHGGSLEIDSQENKGTQVRIRLPLIDDEE